MKKRFFLLMSPLLICAGCFDAPLRSATPEKSGSTVTRTSNIIAGQDRKSEGTANLKSCDGQPHGSTKTGYVSKTASEGGRCKQVTTTCDDGMWTDPELYDSCAPYTP